MSKGGKFKGICFVRRPIKTVKKLMDEFGSDWGARDFETICFCFHILDRWITIMFCGGVLVFVL